MSLPGKSTRPLKKRRVMDIEDDDVSGSQQEQQQQQQKPMNGGKREKRKKARISERSTKKRVEGVVSPSPPSSPVAVTKKSVTWNDRDGDMVHVQPDLSQIYSDYQKNDVWYTRKQYKEFLHDRLQTIESHQYTTAKNMNNDDSYCLRGLELFQDEPTSEHFLSKKKLYYSTIKMEQMRQSILGINDPDRFRMLVEAQSNLALHRAQELAAQDMREVVPFLSHSTPSNPSDEHQAQNQNPLKSTSVSSFSDMTRLRNMMESIYGSPPCSLDSSKNTENEHTPNPPFKNDFSSSFNAVQEAGGGSVVSDGSLTSSSSYSQPNTSGQTLFSNESIRKLQQRSMRRLMGIYQSNDGEGTEGESETKSLFKFARKDSLVGIGKNSASGNDAITSNKNSVWAVPTDTAPSSKKQIMDLLHRRRQEHEDPHRQQEQTDSSEDATSILQQRIKGLMHHRRLLESNHQQEQQLREQRDSIDDATTILRERIAELMHQRKQLYDNHQQQQQITSPRNDTPSLQDQIMEMMQRRKLLEEHLDHQQQQQIQQQQQASSEDMSSSSLVEHVIEMIERRKFQEDHHQEQISPGIGAIGPHFGNDCNSNRTVEEFFIQQQQRQEEHQQRMQQALMAMTDSRFPIRRDTLSHVRTNEASENHSLPWNVPSMA